MSLQGDSGVNLQETADCGSMSTQEAAGIRISLHEALAAGEQYLRERGIDDAPTDAWLLLEYVTGIRRAMFLAERRSLMKPEDFAQYQELLQKRGTHIPLQHLTGEQEFMGFSFKVNEHVLIPRQDTELLVEEALAYLKPGMRVLDLCTGSGCIGISLAKLCPGSDVTASDLSREALAAARENGRALEAEISWVHSDLFERIDGTFDLIVSNPPYICTSVIEELSEEVRLHEPYGALDGHEDGLYFYRQIVKEAGKRLNPGGFLMFEIGYDQGESVSALLRDAGFRNVAVKKDLAGLDRVVTGSR